MTDPLPDETPLDRIDAGRIVDSILALDPLSELPRTGWRLRGVVPCESIADHSFGVGVLTMMLIDHLRRCGMEIDGEQALRMALLHDAAEARTGDIPMPSKTPDLRRALKQLERRLVHQMLPPGLARTFDEAAAGDSLEARIVRAADKLQMMIKLLRYEQTGRGLLDEFWANPGNVRDEGLPGVRAVYAEVFRRGGRELPAR